MHVAGTFHTDEELTDYDRHNSRVIDQQDNVVAMDAIMLQDGHGRVVPHLGVVLVWHNQIER